MIRLATVLLFCFALTASAQGAHSVALTWAWSQGTGDAATGFHVQRGTATGGPYTTIATISSPTTLTFTDTAVAAGQTLFYVVTAFNSAGDSAASNEVRCVIPFQAPTAPAGLSAVVK